MRGWGGWTLKGPKCLSSVVGGEVSSPGFSLGSCCCHHAGPREVPCPCSGWGLDPVTVPPSRWQSRDEVQLMSAQSRRAQTNSPAVAAPCLVSLHPNHPGCGHYGSHRADAEAEGQRGAKQPSNPFPGAPVPKCLTTCRMDKQAPRPSH